MTSRPAIPADQGPAASGAGGTDRRGTAEGEAAESRRDTPDRVEQEMARAVLLATAVRIGPGAVARLLDDADMPALVIALAALVPLDRTPSRLLAWTRYQPHGTHAAFNRHKAHGQEPCVPCRTAETTYQAARPYKAQRYASDHRRAAA